MVCGQDFSTREMRDKGFEFILEFNIGVKIQREVSTRSQPGHGSITMLNEVSLLSDSVKLGMRITLNWTPTKPIWKRLL